MFSHTKRRNRMPDRQSLGTASGVTLAGLQVGIAVMHGRNNLTFLVTGQGRPFSAAGFGNLFREVRGGITETVCLARPANGGRAYLADRSATQLMAWFSWKCAHATGQIITHAKRQRHRIALCSQGFGGQSAAGCKVVAFDFFDEIEKLRRATDF
jgi:hypothetical protein